ncbi:TPA: transposase [Legionella pneumophila]|nr:hypothetical protein BJK09_06525 [Legionella pneumophila]HAT6808713.1 transposase [Legionella pneumophila]HAT6944405.1 transposase [Legionella pneumophila]HAT7045295.1 transposase [Legionella pneumophila]HAT8180050.1 transposase [Legionella pneumophila]
MYARIGVSWQNIPGCNGNWHTIYTHFKHRSENGLFWFLAYPLQQHKRIMDYKCAVTIINIHRNGYEHKLIDSVLLHSKQY